MESEQFVAQIVPVLDIRKDLRHAVKLNKYYPIIYKERQSAQKTLTLSKKYLTFTIFTTTIAVL